ncbi:hypothetical protein RJ640_027702 [Escallonia rubra]|uniref:Uncharacterized protein n=1 Tax=Escallonia rubra TaxID=112253 RepID=A0AA88UQM3_9ASTE|nr:hypothetical protein RJ640_027702 [Escallonia rubra]
MKVVATFVHEEDSKKLISERAKTFPHSSLGWVNKAKCADDPPFRPTYQISQEKAKTLGIDFIPLEESIKETVESLKEKGFHES